MRPKGANFLKPNIAVANPKTPHRKTPISSKVSPVYGLALRLLRDLMFFVLMEETIEKGNCPVKSSKLYKVCKQAEQFGGGPFPDVADLHINLLKEIANRFRVEATIPQDVRTELWDNNVWRFLMIAEEILLYNPVPDTARTFKSTMDKKSNIVWGPRVDPRYHAFPVRLCEVTVPIMDMLSVMGQQLNILQAAPTPAMLSWFQERVKPEFAYWSAVSRVVDIANKKQNEEQIYLHQMAELAILMTDRNTVKKKQLASKGWLPLPEYRKNGQINIGKKPPMKLNPEEVLKEKTKILIGAPILNTAQFAEQQREFEKRLVTNISELQSNQQNSAVQTQLVAATPRSLGHFQGSSVFQESFELRAATQATGSDIVNGSVVSSQDGVTQGIVFEEPFEEPPVTQQQPEQQAVQQVSAQESAFASLAL